MESWHVTLKEVAITSQSRRRRMTLRKDRIVIRCRILAGRPQQRQFHLSFSASWPYVVENRRDPMRVIDGNGNLWWRAPINPMAPHFRPAVKGVELWALVEGKRHLLWDNPRRYPPT